MAFTLELGITVPCAFALGAVFAYLLTKWAMCYAEELARLKVEQDRNR